MTVYMLSRPRVRWDLYLDTSDLVRPFGSPEVTGAPSTFVAGVTDIWSPFLTGVDPLHEGGRRQYRSLEGKRSFLDRFQASCQPRSRWSRP